MKRYLAVISIGLAAAIPFVGSAAVIAPSQALACTNAHMPDGTKCLQSGEYCSHKAGYAADYHRAGFTCKSNGRLEEI
jgi:hypothetical protein